MRSGAGGRTYRKGNFARITVVVLGPRELPVAIRSRESDRIGPPRCASGMCECGTHTVRATSSRSEAGRRRIATAASLNTRTPVRILVIMTLFLRITLRIEFVLRLRVDGCVLIARDVHTGQNCNDHVNAHADRLLIITVILRQLSAASTSTPSNAHVCAEMRDRKRERDSSTSRRCRGKGVKSELLHNRISPS